MIRLCLMTLGLAVLPIAAVAAAPPPPVTAASAVWTDEGHVELAVTWDGGACEQPGEAEVTAGPDQTDVVTIPTVETAEVCTMQIVEVEYSGVIAVEPSTTTLSVTVLDAEGQPKAAGTVEIETSQAAAGE